MTPGKGGTEFEGIPIYNRVSDAVQSAGANATAICVPAAFAADAMLEAIEAGMGLIVCMTEGIPVLDMVKVKHALKGSGAYLIVPNSPGITTPGVGKIGFMPNFIHKEGAVGVISRSGTLTYEVIWQLTSLGIGQSTSIGIGGDPVVGSSFLDLLALYNNDPQTAAIVLIGEIGGMMCVDDKLENLATALRKWEEEARKQFAKDPGAKSAAETLSGMPVKELYTPLDMSGDYAESLGFPGSYPFTRGVQQIMYRYRLRTMRQYVGFGSAEDTNRRFRYLLEQGQTGLSVDDIGPRLSFFFSSHQDFFEEAAKFRAARRIWAHLMKERFQAKNPRSWMLRYHAQTAGCSLTAQQPLLNILRTGYEALSAVLGGGIIREEDIPPLKAIGIREIFGPGTETGEIIAYVKANLSA